MQFYWFMHFDLIINFCNSHWMFHLFGLISDISVWLFQDPFHDILQLTHVFGFTFRSTWDYLRALLRPKFLLSSASLSEPSLLRVCGKSFEYFAILFIINLIFQDTLGIGRSSLLVFHATSMKRNTFIQLKGVNKFYIG